MAGNQQEAVGNVASAGVPPKVLAVVAPVIVAGALTVAFAIFRYVDTPKSASDVAALLGLMASMALAERFPVPVEGVSAGGVTLGFVFSVSAIILLGWPAGVIVAAGGPDLHAPAATPPAVARGVQRLDVRALGARRRGGDRARRKAPRPARWSAGSCSAGSSTTGSSISC